MSHVTFVRAWNGQIAVTTPLVKCKWFSSNGHGVTIPILRRARGRRHSLDAIYPTQTSKQQRFPTRRRLARGSSIVANRKLLSTWLTRGNFKLTPRAFPNPVYKYRSSDKTHNYSLSHFQRILETVFSSKRGGGSMSPSNNNQLGCALMTIPFRFPVVAGGGDNRRSGSNGQESAAGGGAGYDELLLHYRVSVTSLIIRG